MTTETLCDHCSQPSDVDHDPTTDRRDHTPATTTREVDRISVPPMRSRVIGRVTIHLCEHHAADVDAEEAHRKDSTMTDLTPTVTIQVHTCHAKTGPIPTGDEFAAISGEDVADRVNAILAGHPVHTPDGEIVLAVAHTRLSPCIADAEDGESYFPGVQGSRDDAGDLCGDSIIPRHGYRVGIECWT